MLNNALIQTGWEGAALDERNWQDVVRRRLEAQAWERVAADVQPFLQNPREAELLTWSTFAQLLEPSPRTTS